ncbi:hypothetical protein CHS0354_029643 [Potamilus streckersoni]|uniref:SOUL heme-binding protein n=1 Tax=Potamilus streckersoni TaxID=2493646 RepID=A0AAE0RTQ7_9BIVA|nr:hypothetical protein CHS0354_029643 [Potamilus streckersoni]
MASMKENYAVINKTVLFSCTVFLSRLTFSPGIMRRRVDSHKDYMSWRKSRSIPAIQTRRLRRAKWASTVLVGLDYQEAIIVGFRRLFHYLRGENQTGVQMTWTTPMLTKVHPNNPRKLTISFFVPPVFQGKPPYPLNHDVFLETLPDMTLSVKQLQGGLNTEELLNEASLMTSYLKGRELISDAIYTAQYDQYGRRSELWLVHE